MLKTTLAGFRKLHSAGDAIVDEVYGLRAHALAKEADVLVEMDRRDGHRSDEARK